MALESQVLVLGAYGLAGRAVVARLAAGTQLTVTAAGRDANRLHAVLDALACDRLRPLVLDVTDGPGLEEACRASLLVINAVGPYDRHGARIAQAVAESGRPYVDCANEQTHYQRLKELDGVARKRGVAMVTGAGAIPGLSTLLTAHMLARFPEAEQVDCCWAQFRHAYADTGLGSVMGGILEAAHRPMAICDGAPRPVILGRSVKDFELPEPFGRRRLLEVPTIDTLTLSERFPLRELHTWFYLGDLPTWLLGLVRLLQPHRRRWAYTLIERIMKRVNDQDTARAIAAGVGAETLLQVSLSTGAQTETSRVLFRDGAAATACLPVHIAEKCLSGGVDQTGLLTPLDLVEPAVLWDSFGDAILRMEAGR